MAVGPQDLLDQRLVQKYANLQMNNLQGIKIESTMVDPEKMMSAMNDYACVTRNAFALQNKLKDLCCFNASSVYQSVTRV